MPCILAGTNQTNNAQTTRRATKVTEARLGTNSFIYSGLFGLFGLFLLIAHEISGFHKRMLQLLAQRCVGYEFFQRLEHAP